MKKQICALLVVALTILSFLAIPALAVDSEMSAQFRSILNENGNLEVKMYQPNSNEDTGPLGFIILDTYSTDDYYVESVIGSYIHATNTMDIILVNKSNQEQETHNVTLEFIYDEAVKAEADAILASFPAGNNGEVPTFHVVDMEFINYLVNDNHVQNLLNYSGDFKQLIGYKNFKGFFNRGDGESFSTIAWGTARFTYNGTVYGEKAASAKTEHILYVPQSTEDTPEAQTLAAQNRLDAYLGENTLTLNCQGTVRDYALREHYNGTKNQWSQWKADATFEEWKTEYCPTHCPNHVFGPFVGGITENTTCCTVEINGRKYEIAIMEDDSKMVNPTYKNVDVKTDVTVSTEDSSVPLDTLIAVDKINKGEKYQKIIDRLNVKENETFDIKLHSYAKDAYITKLENGQFEVRIPITSELKNKELSAYFIDENDKIIEYPVTVKDNYAIFYTDHFSIYTLAETTTDPSPTGGNSEQQVENPPTGDNLCWMFLPLCLTASIGLIGLLYKKKKTM